MQSLRGAGGRPLLLSGGSGITPIMSMLRWLADAGELMRVILLHCGRRPEDIAFRDELEALGRQGLDLHFLLSRGEIRSWQHDHRHICGDVLRDLVPDAAHRAAYICGPEGFMSAAQVAVAEIGIQSVYTESFGKNRRTEHPQPDACVNSSNGRVAFLGNGSTYDCAAGETVLDAAEACGIWLNLGCRQGVCGNCRCRLISGSVDMNAVGGLTEEERSEGWILPCCSLPRGPITVQV